MGISITVLILALAGIIGCVHARKSARDGRAPRSLAESCLVGAVIFGVLLVVLTEGLGHVGRLEYLWILSAWTMIAVGSGLLWAHLRSSARAHVASGRIRWRMPGAALVAIAVIAGTTAAIGVISPPNNWDSMTYHMSRVAHWIQNGSVAHYPTAIPRQLFYPPGAEYLLLHVYLLAHGDRFVNLVQWGAMVGCLTGVAVIARQLGGGRRAQVLAALLCATLPMGILQASSTQNDYVAAFWIVCAVHFTLKIMAEGYSPSCAALLGGSIGLGLLTKASVYFYILPFAGWLLVWGAVRLKRRVWRPILIVGAISIALNASFWWRNVRRFGNPMRDNGTTRDRTAANNAMSPRRFVSNVTRNLALHGAVPSGRLTARISSSVRWFLCAALGVDPDDPATTFGRTSFELSSAIHEDISGNPLHLAGALGSIFLLVRYRPQAKRDKQRLVGFTAATWGAFLALCLVTKWQPWGARLHLPVFVLLCASTSVVLAGTLGGRALAAVAVAVAIACLPWLLRNESRPLIGRGCILLQKRPDMYFANRRDLRAPYQSVARFLREQQCQEVGLICGRDGWEFPLWVFLNPGSGKSGMRLEHVMAEDASSESQGWADANGAQTSRSGAAPRDFLPGAIVRMPDGSDALPRPSRSEYDLVWESGPLQVFLHAQRARVGRPARSAVGSMGAAGDTAALREQPRQVVESQQGAEE